MNVGYILVSGISECNFQCFARLLSIEVYQLIFPAQVGYRTFFLGILPFLLNENEKFSYIRLFSAKYLYSFLFFFYYVLFSVDL